MLIGSIYGGCFTLIIILTLIAFFVIKFNEMWDGQNDISKQTIKLNDFTDSEFKSINMADFNFMPSVAIRLINSGLPPSAALKNLMISQT